MATYQNNMHCPCRHTPPHAPAARMRRIESCPEIRNVFPEGTPLAMSYIPWQQWREIYEPDTGFTHGTIFKELDKPFLWKGGRCR